MDKLEKIFLGLAFVLCFAACGDDSGSNAGEEKKVAENGSEVTEIVCDAASEGLDVKPADSENARVCKDGKWVEVPASSSSSSDIASSAEKKQSSSSQKTVSSSSTPRDDEKSLAVSSSSKKVAASSSSKKVAASSSSEKVVASCSSEKVATSSSSKKVVASSSSKKVATSSSSEKVVASCSSEKVATSCSSEKVVSSSSEKTIVMESSSSETSGEESSSSSLEVESSSSEKVYLCEDGVTYVVDPENCEKISSSSREKSSSSEKPVEIESSSSENVESSSATDAGIPYSSFECDAEHEGYLKGVYYEEDPNYWWEYNSICISNKFESFRGVYPETYNCTGELGEMVVCTPIPGTEGRTMFGLKSNYVKYLFNQSFKDGMKKEDDISVSYYKYTHGTWVKITAPSSSSVAISSSSEAESSNSGSISYGFMADLRDKKVYKTVTIASQTWMAENLNYADSSRTVSLKKRSWCYDNESINCNRYGRLYTWAAAIDSAALAKYGQVCGYTADMNCTLPRVVQGICPDGWHLPDTSEWKALLDAVSGSSTAATALKMQIGWNSYSNVSVGTNAYGFSAFPAGYRNYNENFAGLGYITHYWTSNVYTLNGALGDAYSISLNYNNEDALLDGGATTYAYSVRCVQGAGETPIPNSSGSVSGSSSSVCKSPKEQGNYGSVDCCAYECTTTKYLNQSMLESGAYGQVVDGRDKHVYKTIKIGNQVWLAQNLSYNQTYTSGASDRCDKKYGASYCWEDKSSNCDEYGRLYNWVQAVGANAAYCDEFQKGPCQHVQNRVQGVCPSGWHVPTKAEWNTLDNSLKAKYGSKDDKASRSSVYYSNATNESGLSLVPTGTEPEAAYWCNSGSAGFGHTWVWNENDRDNLWYWTATDDVDEEGYMPDAYVAEGTIFRRAAKSVLTGVRCVKD